MGRPYSCLPKFDYHLNITLARPFYPQNYPYESP